MRDDLNSILYSKEESISIYCKGDDISVESNNYIQLYSLEDTTAKTMNAFDSVTEEYDENKNLSNIRYNVSEDSFIDEFGYPPSINDRSEPLSEWRDIIAGLTTDDIIQQYYSHEYCNAYIVLCYEELKKRYLCGKLHKPKNKIHNSIENNSNISLAEAYPEWAEIIRELTDEELINYIISEQEWQEEYRLLCSEELRERRNMDNSYEGGGKVGGF